MRIIKSIISLRKILQKYRQQNKTIGFVPTMGALHEGHLSLMRKSRRENDITITSIFVNPTQFSPREDFKKYPRQTRQDILLSNKENIDILYCPTVDEMYPGTPLTHIDVAQLTEQLCGKYRPGHFRGVATVVGKLLNIVQPHTLYLGQKDIQQAVIIKKMVQDLNFDVDVQICPTLREKDGLAMSSRNVYLTPKQRQEAPVLYQSLLHLKKLIRQGVVSVSSLKNTFKEFLAERCGGKIQYIDCVSFDNLAPVKTLRGQCVIAAAVYFGQTRLIDNIIVQVK